MRSRRRLETNDSAIDPHRLLSLFVAPDLEALIDTTFGFLRAAVGCEFVSAFYRSAGSGLLKERDSRGREYGPAFMRRFIELTPALPVALANPGIRILLTRTCLPPSPAEVERTAFYREIMQPQGWRHGVALCFWGAPQAASPVFVTTVYRTEEQGDFTEDEIAGLDAVYPFLDCAVNRLLERDAAKTVYDGVALAAGDGTRGVAILDPHHLLVQANPLARRLCAEWGPDADGMDVEDAPLSWRLPPALQEACDELHQQWQSLVRADPDATGLRLQRRVAHPLAPGLAAVITMVGPSTSLTEPAFVLELERRVHGVALDAAERSGPLQTLTATERAVAIVLADGLSNQEIADRLGKSVAAVKFLLHRIYRKTGVPSRAALVAVLRSRPTSG